MRRLVTILGLFCLPATAVADPYADLYGDGLRHYAEGRYDAALESLYRAYALKPSANLLRLIVRSHDFMGHCSAVERQLELFKDAYRADSAPKPQLCANPGTLKIACSTHTERVVVDHVIATTCGATLKLPEGTHKVIAPELNEARDFEVRAGQTSVAELQLNPQKWFPNRAKEGPPGHFTVLKSADGLYEIWLKSDLRDDPEMQGIQIPGFTILRGKDGLYDISSDALKEPYPPAENRPRRKMPVVPIAP